MTCLFSFDMDFNGFHILDLGIFNCVARLENFAIPHQSDLLLVRYLLCYSEIVGDALKRGILLRVSDDLYVMKVLINKPLEQ